MRRGVAALVIVLTLVSRLGAGADTDARNAGIHTVQAILLSVDAPNARVTYSLEGTPAKTSLVASAKVMEKLARMKRGQKVVLRYRAGAPAGEWVIEEANKKANWWKRGIILGVVLLLLVGVVVAANEDYCGGYCAP